MKVFAVVVTYNPDINLLRVSLGSLIHQVDKVLVVDNSTNLDCTNKCLVDGVFTHKLHVISLGRNTGIGYAQNFGIRQALKSGADFILTSDQDSVYPADYVKNMVSAYRHISKRLNVGCIAPAFADLVDKKVYDKFVLYENNKLVVKKIDISCFRDNFDFVEAGFVISSGMFFPANIFDSVGLMNEEMFIDFVDVEWCIRSNLMGHKVVQIPKIVIFHQHGEKKVKFLKFEFSGYSKIRRYYKFRNCLYLMLYGDGFPIGIRLYLLKMLFKMILKHFVSTDNPFVEMKLHLKAFSDGLNKNLGYRSF